MRNLWLVVAVLSVVGCGPTALTPEQKLHNLLNDVQATVPVRGELVLDGQPVKDIWVYLVPKGGKISPDEPPAQRALTQEDGSFVITTYIEGDGAPTGEYVVCAEKLRYRKTGSVWMGPDQLGKKYIDPEKSQFSVTVGSEPVVIPKIELSTAGVVVEDPKKFKGPKRDKSR